MEKAFAAGAMLPAGIVMCRIGGDGKLAFARKYEIEATVQKQQLWAGMIALS